MEKLLEINNISYSYRNSDTKVLDDISFSLNKGDFALLSGESGSGKSTLLRAINGCFAMSDKVSGNIFIQNNDISKMPAVKRAIYIGTVSQNADEQIIFSKIEDEIAFPLENISASKKEMNEKIDLYTELLDLDKNQETAVLSGGQKQKLITATTLVMNNKLIILDEPLANLDINSARILLTTLKKLCSEKNYAVILIEHRLDLVLGYANRFLYMENSKLLEFQNKDELYKINYKSIDESKDALTSEKQGKLLIKIDKISLSIGDKEILKPISIEIREGEKYVITGENGAGKTSFLNIISGLTKKHSGNIEYFDDTLRNFKSLSMILQNPSYQLFMPSVREEIFYQSKDFEFTNEIIDILELNALLDRHPHSLSEGQKRRVGVAAIIATMPKVLLLDEPSVGQDYKNMLLILKAIKHLESKQALTTITVSHDLRCKRLQGDIEIKLLKATR